MLRLAKKLQSVRGFADAKIPAPETNPSIMYCGVSKINCL